MAAKRSYVRNASPAAPLPLGLTPEGSAKAVFARKLQHLLAVKGWTQAELCRRAGTFRPDGRPLERSSVSKYLSGETLPSIQTIEALASALGTTADELAPLDQMKQAGVPTPAQAWSDVADGRVLIHINRVVPKGVALQIWNLLGAEEE